MSFGEYLYHDKFSTITDQLNEQLKIYLIDLVFEI